MTVLEACRFVHPKTLAAFGPIGGAGWDRVVAHRLAVPPDARLVGGTWLECGGARLSAAEALAAALAELSGVDPRPGFAVLSETCVYFNASA